MSHEIVYFLFDSIAFEVKIGKSTEAAIGKRIASLRCANPRLVLVGYLSGRESEFHARFAADRKRGEFFNLSDTLLAFLKSQFPDFSFERELAPTRPAMLSELVPFEFGDAFDHVVKLLPDDSLEKSDAAFAKFMTDGDADYCGAYVEGNDRNECECTSCCVSAVSALASFSPSDFILEAAFLWDVRAVFLLCQDFASQQKLNWLSEIGAYADHAGCFDVFAIGTHHPFDGQRRVLHLNNWLLGGDRPIPIKEFWDGFNARLELERQES